MAVYVDDFRTPAKVAGQRWTMRWSHLGADTDAEFHAFAARLGLRREWFQDEDGRFPHYDVTDSTRNRAIALGAEQVDPYEFVARQQAKHDAAR